MRAYIKKILPTNKDDSGFSLVELLIVMAISGIVAAGLAMAIFQLWHGHARSSGEMNVVRQVQQVGHYITRDTQMAAEVSTVDDPSTTDYREIVTLTWYQYFWDEGTTDRRGEGYRVIYKLNTNGSGIGMIYRDYYEAPDVEGDTPDDAFVFQSSTYIADNIDIDEDNTDCIWTGDKLIIIVTASVEGIAGEQKETRIYEANPRPNIFF